MALLGAALVMAAAYFVAVWLGEALILAVLASRVSRAAKRFFGVPGFHYCALADGIAVLLCRLGLRCPLCRPSAATLTPSRQRVLSFLWQNWRKSADSGFLTQTNYKAYAEKAVLAGSDSAG
jgi:hypothetical protein